MAAPRAVFVPEADALVDEPEVERAALVEPEDPELPDEADEPDDAEAVAVLVGTAGWWAWKPRTAAVPITVAEMTMGARLMCRCSLEGERFEVDPAGWHSRFPQRVAQRSGERLGPADVGIAPAHVAHERAQCSGVERHVMARTGQLNEAASAAPQLARDCVTQDQLLLGRCPQQHHHVGPGGEV